MKRTYRMLIAIILLIALDQLIKLIIHNQYMEKDFDILFQLVRFEPYLNTHYSWINSIGNFGWNRLFHIVLVVVLLLITTLMYHYITYKKAMGKMVATLFIFLYAGGLCSLIDKLLWGGSLDYICLEGLFIFDLKDVYISIFEVIIIGMMVFNYKGLRKLKEKELLMDLFTYLKHVIAVGIRMVRSKQE